MPIPKCESEDDFLVARLVAAMDKKFAQQESVIRELLNRSGPSPADFGFSRSDLGRSRSELSPSSPMASESMTLARPPAATEPPIMEPLRSDATREESKESKDRPHLNKQSTRTLGTAIMTEKWDPEPPMKSFIKKRLDGYMGVVVIINMCFMVVMTQWTGSRAEVSLALRSEPWPFFTQLFFDVSEYVFFVLYVLDVAMRMIVLKREWYYDEQEGVMYLNLFDAGLVALSTVELLILPVALSAGTSGEFQASAIRVLKLMRIYRTLRVVKTMHVFRQLKLLVRTCVASIGALFWSLVLLLLLNIAFALMIAQALQTFIMDDQADVDVRLQMNELYGSFTRSFYTIFEVTHSGSWPSRVRPVLNLVDPWYAALFLPYIALVVFAVIRVVTALFIKETLASAANDAELVIEETRRFTLEYQKKLEELFRFVDEDGNGLLSLEEFQAAMSLPSVQQYMKFLDVSVRDVQPLFDILAEGDGLITITEFCQGVMQLKGQARSLDIIILQHENAKLMSRVQEIYRSMHKLNKSVSVGTSQWAGRLQET